jgi:uncharacterized protein YkwD
MSEPNLSGLPGPLMVVEPMHLIGATGIKLAGYYNKTTDKLQIDLTEGGVTRRFFYEGQVHDSAENPGVRTFSGTARELPLPDRPAPADALLAAHNVERTARKLPALVTADALARAAWAHADWMSRTGTFSHIGVGGSAPWDRAAAAGYPSRDVSENVAMGTTDLAVMMRAWMKSAGHRANVLGPRLDFGGAGVGTYWCCLFGRK